MKKLKILTKAQASAKNMQATAALSVAKMLNETETAYNKYLMDIKRTKEKVAATLKASPTLNQDANQNK